MIYTIEEYIAIPIAKTYGLVSMAFRSHAKGNATSNSDIDYIIEKEDLIGIKYFSLLEDLEKAFNCKIDLITTGFSNKEFLDNIKKDEILIYER